MPRIFCPYRAEQLQPDRVWIPNRSFNNDVTKFGCKILPCLLLIMKVKIGTLGRLLFPRRNKLLSFKSLGRTF